MRILLLGLGLAVAFLLGHAMSAHGDGKAPSCEEERDWYKAYAVSVYDVTVAVQDNRIGKLDKFLAESDCAGLLGEPGMPGMYWALTYRILGTQEMARLMDNKNKWRTSEWDRIDAAMDTRAERWIERLAMCSVRDTPPPKPPKKKAH